MSILDLHADEQVQASLNTAPAPVAPPAKFSAWSAIPRGLAVAAGEVGASAADLVNAARVFRDTPSREIAASGLPTSAFSSELGDTVRSYWNDFRPDPNTATTAEQVLFGFSRGLAKVMPATIVAGPVGAVVAGIEEGMTVSDKLRLERVGADARTKAGMIQGAGLASAALPLLGTTLAETAALYVAGGPGGFMAQQALTRQILRDAGHDDIAAGYDPFDPVGLTMALGLPGYFTYRGVRGQLIATRAKAAADFNAGPVPSEPTPVAAAVAEAVRAPELLPDVVDAAMVNNLRTFGADRVMPAWHAADTFAARLDEAIAERGISVRAGDGSQAGGVAGARSISIADMPEADFMALHGNSVIDVKAHEFAHTFWAGATALPNFKDPANKPLLAEMRQMSKEFRPFVWENHKAHANKPGELMADAMAFWLKHPDRRQDFPLVDKMMRDYDAGGLQRRFPDAVADAYKPAPPRIPPEVVDAAMVQNSRDLDATLQELTRANRDASALTDVIDRAGGDVVALHASEAARLRATAAEQGQHLPEAARHNMLMADMIEARGETLAARPTTDEAPRPVAEEAAPPKTAAEAGDPIAKLNEPADAKPKPAADPIMSTVATRVADLESTAPDMVVRIADDGKHVTLADDLAEVRRMVAEGTDDSLGTLDADLMRVAVECALSTGG